MVSGDVGAIGHRGAPEAGSDTAGRVFLFGVVIRRKTWAEACRKQARSSSACSGSRRCDHARNGPMSGSDTPRDSTPALAALLWLLSLWSGCAACSGPSRWGCRDPSGLLGLAGVAGARTLAERAGQTLHARPDTTHVNISLFAATARRQTHATPTPATRFPLPATRIPTHKHSLWLSVAVAASRSRCQSPTDSPAQASSPLPTDELQRIASSVGHHHEYSQHRCNC
jgi:hypothetical protein